jgi:hypothetical protein
MAKAARTAARLAGRFATPLLLALVLAGWGSSLLLIHQVASAQKAQLTTCELHAVQQFDAALTARTHASNDVNTALQNLIVTVFTPHGTPAAERSADLAAYGAWRGAIAAQEGIKLPALPRTACG